MSSGLTARIIKHAIQKSFPCILASRSYARTKMINFTLIDKEGSKILLKSEVGNKLIDAIIDAGIADFAACGGTLNCSTCHVIFNPEDYSKVGEPVDDSEFGLLMGTPFVTNTSRLSCQVKITEEMEGITVTLPKMVRDARESQ